jgi:hypothetical protein
VQSHVCRRGMRLGVRVSSSGELQRFRPVVAALGVGCVFVFGVLMLCGVWELSCCPVKGMMTWVESSSCLALALPVPDPHSTCLGAETCESR